MPQDLALLMQDTDVHAAGVQIDTAAQWVLGGVESHEVSSSFASAFSPYQHTTRVC
jgi:hypothetical protein